MYDIQFEFFLILCDTHKINGKTELLALDIKTYHLILLEMKKKEEIFFHVYNPVSKL